MAEIEFVENTGIQYIDTGYIPNGEPINPYTIPVCGCRVYDGEELIKDYLPCKNPEGIEGMYDTITGEFLDRDSFVQTWLEHCRRADKISVSWGGRDNG